MLLKTIRYKDFNGNEREEDFYFNLTPAEITEMELRAKGGLQEVLGRIIKEQDSEKMIEYFKSIIRSSYGVKSTDGRNFTKSDRAWEEFASTNAYSKLFMELATNDIAASNFIKGIMPSKSEIDEYTKDVKSMPDSNIASFPEVRPAIEPPVKYDEAALNELVEKRTAERLKELSNNVSAMESQALDALVREKVAERMKELSNTSVLESQALNELIGRKVAETTSSMPTDPTTIPNVIASNMGLPGRPDE